MKVLLIGYVPLLYGDPTDVTMSPDPEDTKRFIKQLPEEYPIKGKKAVIWAMGDDGFPYPIMAMRDAQKVADHLMAWSEGKPEEFFYLSMAFGKELYTVMLHPNITRSIERHKQLRQHLGMEINKDDEYQVFYTPLEVTVPGSDRGLKFNNPSKVGLVDIRDVDPDLNPPLSKSSIIEIGVIPTDHSYAQRAIEGLESEESEE